MAVAAILIVALFLTAQQLDRLSDQSQMAIANTATGMRTSRSLIEQTLAMERSARQYQVLEDRATYETYVNRREEFLESAQLFGQFRMGELLEEQVAALVAAEYRAFEWLNKLVDGIEVSEDFPAFVDLAYEVADAIELWINEQQLALLSQSDATKRTLTLQALWCIGAASLAAALFIVLITRPLQQIDSAINQLGSGGYAQQISIAGPRDLQALGLRLDWLRNRLGELEQQRASFLRHVSHELKTPLASMQEGAALLKDGVVGSLTPEQQEISRIISNNCQRLQGLIEGLLRHNSQNFEVLNVMPEPVRFDQVIDRVIEAHQLLITSGRTRVERNLARLTVMGDSERLRVIIDNLFTNALKYSPEEGIVSLHLFASEGQAVFEISDQGPGIPPTERNRVFEAFYQGSIPPVRDYDGTGLGLAIVREYVLASGGTIELCESDEGACFRVSLPLVRRGRLGG